MTPKIFEMTVKIRYTCRKKIFEIDRENPGIRGK
jgi:hypothetical protein